MKICLTILLALCSFSVFAQILQPVKWKHSYKALESDEYELVFTASIQDGWVTYSQFLESDDGPVRTSLNFESKHQSLIGKAEESSSSPSNRIEKVDPLFDMEVIKYKKKLILTQKVKVTDVSKPLKGYVEFMACNDESCLPPDYYEFSVKLEKAAQNTDTKDPDPKPEPTDENNTNNTTVDNPEIPDPTTNTDENSPGILEPVKWSFEERKISTTELELRFTATIDKGWFVYSQFIGEGGPIPTTFTFEPNDKYTLLGEAEELTSDPANRKEGKEPLFDNMNLIKFKKDYTAVQRVTLKDSTAAIKGFLTFQTCNDEACLPPTNVNFAFGDTTATDVVEKPVDTIGNEIVRTAIKESLAALAKAGDNSENCNNITANTEGQGLLAIFILGFLGGFVALLTPCVFPMVPITVSYFTKRSKTKAEGARNGFIYGASIVVIYVSLGLLLTISFGSDALNLISTHWIPNVLFFVLFIAFAISFFGYYDIKLPSSWTNSADRAADRGGLLGIFFMASTLSLVSFSCTGPIIGTLLVNAADGGVQGPLMGMFGFSLALALPFALLSAFPGWLQSLPSSGGWMNTVKVVLGFLELALSFKFLSKADLVQDWGILKYEVFMGAVILSLIGMAVYLLGLIRFPHDNPNAKIGMPRRAFGVTVIGFAAYLSTGFMVNPDTGTYSTPWIMSGIAPPACYSYLYPCDCPPGINDCFKDYYKGLAEAKRLNKPVLLDFTGHGCENCRKMEDNVWVEDKVNVLINEKFVLISLYVDERTRLPEVRTTAAGKKLRTVGNLWAEFERANFGQNSQPLYIVLSPEEEVLNGPVGYTPDVDEYEGFLQCGLDRFTTK